VDSEADALVEPSCNLSLELVLAEGSRESYSGHCISVGRLPDCSLPASYWLEASATHLPFRLISISLFPIASHTTLKIETA